MTVDLGNCIPGCPVCYGYGFIPKSYEDLPITDPDYGKVSLCPNTFKVHWPGDCGISQEEAHKLNLKVLVKTPLVNLCGDYLKKILHNKTGMIYIYGSVGIGKSVLMKSTLLWAMFKLGINPVHYTTHAIMMDRLRSSFGDKSNNNLYNDNLKYYSELPVLAIDEVGRDKDSEFSLASFGKIIDRRYTLAKEGKAITLFGSNFPPEDILDIYLVDRIRDISNYVVSAELESLRRTKIELVSTPNWWKEI